MRIFDLNNLNFQDALRISDQDIIKDFYNTHLQYWKNDIYNFDIYFNNLSIENIKNIIIWVSDEWNYTFDLMFVLNDGTMKSVNIKKTDMINWLIKNNMIEK